MSKPKRIELKEIPWGTPVDDPDGTIIYANGHVDKTEFLSAVKAWPMSDVPDDTRAELTIDDVEHICFKRMSPTEARGNGLGWGVWQTQPGETCGYPVTAVKL